MDTNALLWYLFDPDALSRKAKERIDASRTEGSKIFLSAISLIEMVGIDEKQRQGGKLLSKLREALRDERTPFEIVPIDMSTAEDIRGIPRDSLPDLHDRIVVVAARSRSADLVTRDREIRSFYSQAVW